MSYLSQLERKKFKPGNVLIQLVYSGKSRTNDLCVLRIVKEAQDDV